VVSMHTRIAVGKCARLRDLTADEFHDSYHCDRFTASVLAGKFSYIVDHMVAKVIAAAFSPIIRNSTDMSATLQAPPVEDWQMAAVGKTVPLFNGSIAEGVRVALEEYGIESLKPNDLVIVNDYYRVGTHLNDAAFIRPIFSRDATQLLGTVTVRAHMLDMGGSYPGGFDSTKSTSFDDGLFLPPTLLFDGGEPVRGVFSLITGNTRFGEMIIPDIFTINSALGFGADLVVEAVEKYGTEAYFGAIRFACDAAAERMTASLARIPDGRYVASEILDSDTVDDSPEYRVHVAVIKQGDRVEFDLSDSSPATRSAVNCTWLDAKTAVGMALKILLDPRSPFTSGALRNVDIVLPPDSFINVAPPHPCQYYWEPLHTIMQAIFKALKEALGPDAVVSDGCSFIHNTTGVLADGRPWVTVTPDEEVAPWPATKGGDGDSNQTMIYLNQMEAGIEALEADSPVVMLGRDLLTDTAGAGQYRGGAAALIDTLWPLESRHNMTHFHLKYSPAGGGVLGGQPGILGAGWVWNSQTCDLDLSHGLPRSLAGEFYKNSTPLLGVVDPETNELSKSGSYVCRGTPYQVGPGSVARVLSNAAAGWGDPLERTPEAVLRDVRDEYVSLAAAEQQYGVVLIGDPASDPESLTIDDEATRALRGRRRTMAGGRTSPTSADPPWDGPTTSVDRTPVAGTCPECRAEGLHRYPVLAERGWWMVVKCSECLHSVSREPWHRLGWISRSDGLPA
jgi:N-methylhydantoinase B